MPSPLPKLTLPENNEEGITQKKLSKRFHLITLFPFLTLVYGLWAACGSRIAGLK